MDTAILGNCVQAFTKNMLYQFGDMPLNSYVWWNCHRLQVLRTKVDMSSSQKPVSNSEVKWWPRSSAQLSTAANVLW